MSTCKSLSSRLVSLISVMRSLPTTHACTSGIWAPAGCAVFGLSDLATSQRFGSCRNWGMLLSMSVSEVVPTVLGTPSARDPEHESWKRMMRQLCRSDRTGGPSSADTHQGVWSVRFPGLGSGIQARVRPDRGSIVEVDVVQDAALDVAIVQPEVGVVGLCQGLQSPLPWAATSRRLPG
jgi:hypothetical protein